MHQLQNTQTIQHLISFSLHQVFLNYWHTIDFIEVAENVLH